MNWKGCKVLVTGGLGFIGSNLARALVEREADVLLTDNMLPSHGGNLFNIEGIADHVRVNYADVTDIHTMNYLVQSADLVYHLAGQVNHVASIVDPFTDVKINALGTLTLLEACRQHNPNARIVFTGTRGEYGPSVNLPVDEEHPTNPMGIYAVTNLTAEHMLRVYHRVHGIESVLLRVTNTYGPRHQMRHSQYGVVNWFVRQVLDQRPITVMGDGCFKRDLLYIDDLVAAMLRVAECGTVSGEVLNVGTGTPTTFMELAHAVIEAAGEGDVVQVPFSEERRRIEPGNYYADVSKIRRLTGWRAETPLVEGLRRTFDFYRDYRQQYWEVCDAADGSGDRDRRDDGSIGRQRVA
jgi:UDP-glucose 4-epimerase